MKRELWIADEEGVRYNIFDLPKGKHLVFKCINLSGMGLTELPDLSSVEVELFDCSNNKLKSLKGSPKVVHDDFKCHHNLLESFECTTKKAGQFYCYDNRAKSLEGMPQDVCHIICGDRYLQSLKGAPAKIKGVLRCRDAAITNLEGAPQEIGGNLELKNNQFLETLKGGPQVVGRSATITKRIAMDCRTAVE